VNMPSYLKSRRHKIDTLAVSCLGKNTVKQYPVTVRNVETPHESTWILRVS